MKPIQLCKSLFALASLMITFSSCKKENVSRSKQTIPAESSQAVAAAAPTYQLVWSDEFNGTSVNTANRTFETGAGGWGNNEQQYYRSQNATVSNGNLVITAKRESFGGASYTSAR